MTVRYAWPTLAEAPTVEIDGLALDDADLPADALDPANQRIRLDGAGPWQRFSCRVGVGPLETLPAGLESPTVFAVAASATSASRVPFPLGPGPASGRIELHRQELGRDVQLTVEVAARHRGRLRVIARTDPWTLMVEPGVAPMAPGSPPFDMVWIDFGSDDAPTLARTVPTAPAVMDVATGTRPQLLLNSGLPGFQNLLHADTAQKERRRLRDLLGADVARMAVATILRAAVGEVARADDGSLTLPDDPLHRRVCEAVAEAMVGVGSVDEFYEYFAQGDAPSSEAWARADLAVDDLVGRRSAWATACEEVRVV